MTPQLRVLLVTKSTGGLAAYVRRLIPAMDRSKFAFTVACLSENSREFAAELAAIPGTQTFSLEMNRYQIDPLSDAKVFFQLRRHIRAGQYDLIHAHASKPGYLARFAAVGTGIPVVYSPHGFSFHAGVSRLKALFYATLERIAAPLTRKVITVSEGERELARRYRIGPDSLFEVVHTGIDPEPFRRPVDIPLEKEKLEIPPSASLVGSVGRFIAQKSPLDFVRMAGLVHQRRPGVHFLWIGTGPLEADVKRLSNELGLDSVFHFAGQRQDVPALLNVMDCMVLSSRWEGFPLVVLEALAANVPIVATDIAGTREAIESGSNGWLVPVGDHVAMADRVMDILENPQRAAAFKRAGCRRIDEEFTTQQMYDRIEAIYLSAISNSKKMQS